LSLGNIINFSAGSSEDLDGEIVSYAWDFGDNSAVDYIKTVLHSYREGGEKTVRLSVKDNDGAISNTSNDIFINTPPIARFSIDPQEPNIDEPVSFNASLSSDSDGKILEYSWDFGEGKVEPEIYTSEFAVHAYYRSQKYNVKLTVEDDKGATGSFKQLVEVEGINNKPNAISFQPDKKSPHGGASWQNGASVNDLEGSLTEDNVIDNMDDNSSWVPLNYGASTKTILLNGSNDSAIRIDYDLDEQIYSGIYKNISPEELKNTTGIKLFYNTSEDIKTIEVKLEDTDKSDRFVEYFGEKSRIDESGILEVHYNDTECISQKGPCSSYNFSTDRIKRIVIAVARKAGAVKGWLIISKIQGFNETQM
jgi:PKD repeat protein